MAKKKEPAKPYYSVAHEYADSLEAFKAASSNLYTSVTSLLSMEDHLKEQPSSQAVEKILSVLRDRSEEYRKAVYGDE